MLDTVMYKTKQISVYIKKEKDLRTYPKYNMLIVKPVTFCTSDKELQLKKAMINISRLLRDKRNLKNLYKISFQ